MAEGGLSWPQVANRYNVANRYDGAFDVIGPAALGRQVSSFTPTRDGGNAARLPSPGEPPE